MPYRPGAASVAGHSRRTGMQTVCPGVNSPYLERLWMRRNLMSERRLPSWLGVVGLATGLVLISCSGPNTETHTIFSADEHYVAEALETHIEFPGFLTFYPETSGEA